MTEYDTDDQSLITCPHCGRKERNSWERRLGDGDAEESECGSCGKPFIALARVLRTFSTYKIKGGLNDAI